MKRLPRKVLLIKREQDSNSLQGPLYFTKTRLGRHMWLFHILEEMKPTCNETILHIGWLYYILCGLKPGTNELGYS